MKLKTLLLTTALVASNLAFAAAPAHPAKKSKSQFADYYAKIELGGTKANKLKGSLGNYSTSLKSKTGFVGGIGGGYIFNEFFKTDLMLQYKRNKFKTSGIDETSGIDVDTYAAMLNGYLTAHNDTIFTPYLKAGVGVGHNKLKFRKKDIFKKTNFIWNLGFGCDAKVADQTSVGIEYRYVNLGKGGSKTIENPLEKKVKVKAKIKDIKAHEIVAGLTYHF